MGGALVEEIAVGTVLHDKQGDNANRQQRWERMRRAELLDQYRSLQTQGVSQRQAAKTLDYPCKPRPLGRGTLCWGSKGA